MSIYDFTVKDSSGADVPLSKFKNKTLLIVNTATGCGFTPQYKALEALYEKYKDSGFVIMDFPCNQFGHQAPGTIDEINTFCETTYHTTFPRFQKIDVNGPNADPLFNYLKSQKKGRFGRADIEWNFTKFLIDKSGKVVGRFKSSFKPEKLSDEISNLC
jgi:glutathione peroxidase